MDIEIIDKGAKSLKPSLAITGFPDVGLVGTIAASHIIKTLNLTEIGYVKSNQLPPITVVHGNRPKPPVRIYGNNNLFVLISEIPIIPSIIQNLSEKIVDWLNKKGVPRVVILGGIENPQRLELKEPGIYGVATDDKGSQTLKKGRVRLMEEGFLAGQDGVILLKCSEKNISSLYLMAESHYGFPDPGAAASIIKALNNLFQLKLEVKSLLEKEDEIRLLSRELMKRTEENLRALEKEKEKEIPVMYG